MIKKLAAAAALAATTLLATTPALADGYRHGDRRAPERVVVVKRDYGHDRHAYRRSYERRPVVVQRTVVQRPVVVHRSSHDVLGGLILGAVLGAVIANHAGY